jgi:cytoskeletal protein CcmA (bactofilin family)
MSCFSEFSYSLYVDRELPPDEVRRVEAHLSVCERCRALAGALQAENLLLSEAFQAGDEELLAVAGRPSLAWRTLGVFAALSAAAVGLETAGRWVASLLPRGAERLNPVGPVARWTVFFTVVDYLAREGGNMLVSALSTTFSLILFGLLVLCAAQLARGRRRVRATMVFWCLLILSFSRPASALERRSGSIVTVPRGQTVDDTLLVAGDTASIDGLVTGNLLAIGRHIAIRGTVRGDVFNFAQRLDVDGTVEGNVISFSQFLDVRGHVVHGVHLWGQQLQLDSEGRVDGEVTAAGNSIEVSGAIGHNLRAYSGYVALRSPARIGGNVEAYVNRAADLSIEPDVTISGKTITHLAKSRPSRYTRARFYYLQVLRLAAALLTGLVLFWLSPRLLQTRLDGAGAVLRVTGTGFLVLVASPVAAIIAGLTLIGLPLALLALAAWLAGLYLAKIFVAALLGQSVARPRLGQPRPFALDLLIGLAIVFIAVNLPYLGAWIGFLVVLLGLGLAFIQARGQVFLAGNK